MLFDTGPMSRLWPIMYIIIVPLRFTQKTYYDDGIQHPLKKCKSMCRALEANDSRGHVLQL